MCLWLVVQEAVSLPKEQPQGPCIIILVNSPWIDPATSLTNSVSQGSPEALGAGKVTPCPGHTAPVKHLLYARVGRSGGRRGEGRHRGGDRATAGRPHRVRRPLEGGMGRTWGSAPQAKRAACSEAPSLSSCGSTERENRIGEARDKTASTLKR